MTIDKCKNKAEIIQLLQSTNRSGVDTLIEDMAEMGFFEAPASAAYHLNIEGGLAQHALNTYRAAMSVWQSMQQLEPSLEKEIAHESIILASLLHDLCKTDIYKQSVRKRKNIFQQWENYEGYRVTYKSFPIGHGEKSVIMALCSGLDLDDAEMLAIRWHMGAWGVNMNSYDEIKNYNAARALYPLVVIIQVADGLAAALMERSSESIDEL